MVIINKVQILQSCVKQGKILYFFCWFLSLGKQILVVCMFFLTLNYVS